MATFDLDPVDGLPPAPDLVSVGEFNDLGDALLAALEQFVIQLNDAISDINTQATGFVTGTVTQGGNVVVEEGENANGRYTKYLSGLIVVRHRLAMDRDGLSEANAVYTYPIAGLSNSVILPTLDRDTSTYDPSVGALAGPYIDTVGANSSTLRLLASSGLFGLNDTADWDITHVANWFTT